MARSGYDGPLTFKGAFNYDNEDALRPFKEPASSSGNATKSASEAYSPTLLETYIDDCVCVADDEQGETEPLHLKPNSSIIVLGKHVVKQFNHYESLAYTVLRQHEESLHLARPRIRIPEIVHQDAPSSSVIMTKVAKFPNLNPAEYFGEWSGYNKDTFAMYFGAFNALRNLPLDPSVDFGEDYEQRLPSGISSLTYLARLITPLNNTKLHTIFNKVKDVAEASQEQIEALPRLMAHRDPNPNNYAFCSQHDTATIIDWETFGTASAGYDEGRLYSYLSLRPDVQYEYSQQATETLPARNLIYFWRVAMMRCLREMSLFESGHYDMRREKSGQKQPPVRTFTSAFANAIDRCIDEAVVCL